MTKLLPTLGALVGTFAISGAGAFLLTTQKLPKINESFQFALIKLDDTEEALLQAKLGKLKGGEILSDNKKLKEAKEKTTSDGRNGLEEFKDACKEIYNSNFTNKESNIFKDFQNYCSRTIKEKLSSVSWDTTSAGNEWKTRHEKLKTTQSELVSELIKISKKTSTDGNELKAWCEKNGELVFEGESDKVFKNIKEFCIKE